MELQTIRQVSADHGISARMLRYYEQIGLIESSRMEDYAYRVYDEAAVKRLQQIIILRKLQIPMKQIKDILNNQNAVEVIEIFKRNIGELDEKITALSAVRSILARFVDELQEKADVHLELDLLNDKTMLAVAGALSFSENKIKEKVSMEELSKAAEQMTELIDRNVRVVYFPPTTVVYARADRAEGYGEPAKPILQKFIDDVDLFMIKPDTRIFGYNETMLATIPEDIDVPAPLIKGTIPGGLIATAPLHEVDSVSLEEWVERSDIYEWNPGRPGGVEYINPFSEFGGKSVGTKATGFTYKNVLISIKEIGKITEEQKEKIAELDKLYSCGKLTYVDLASIIKRGNPDMVLQNGLLELTIEGEPVGHDKAPGAETLQQFKCPLKIELRAKTDGEIYLNYATGFILLNWEDGNRTTLFIRDILIQEYFSYKKCGAIPFNKFVDIEWTLDRDAMIVKVNGEIRHIGSDYGYIKAFKENPEFCISSEVAISAARGTTVTIECLRITELQ